MTLKSLKNKKIAFLGLGVENYALIEFLLSKKINCKITVCNLNDPFKTSRGVELKQHNTITWKCGKNYDKNLEKFDIIFRSPGYPPSKLKNIKSKIIGKITTVTSPMQLFFNLCPTKNIIGVTGTKGKGTTSSMITAIIEEHLNKKRLEGKKRDSIASLQNDNVSVFLGGNIGVAPFSFISEIQKDDFVVLELSSFQLEDLETSPHIAIITNFTPEHLSLADPNNPNFHKSMPAYWKAKSNIFLHQNKNNYLIINNKLNSKIKKQSLKSTKINFNKSNLKTPLVGEHNKENIATVVEVAKILKIKNDIIIKAIKKFKGLPHRIELVKEKNNIKFYDDSFATTPESAITALKSFEKNKIILLAGGADKGSDFKQFAKEIKNRVKFLILLEGIGTKKIKAELNKIDFSSQNSQLVHNIKDAVKLAKDKAKSDDIILLSTACASFGMFNNYKERGDLFKKEVLK
ncbi:UDP-N-acetylmuramoyl-L-alanine--D-glutamate ligase [Candidatus Parcubacteria bacterium]|nr:UDP-N-acetylmuramoyl-L-alanine--D-glutamate ligase [Candidatus Parcubacteria bacterium]